MDKLIPTPEQEEAIQEMVSSPAGILGADPGTGKTLMGVETLLRTWSTRSLIIAPASTWDNWRDTLAAQSEGLETLRACANSKLASDVTARECKANLEALLTGEDGHFFITRELFRELDWHTVPDVDPKTKTPRIDEKTGKPKTKRAQKKIWRKHPFTLAIFDESHVAANTSNRGFKSWRDLVADHKFSSSGTPFGDKFENAWGAANAVYGTEVTDTEWLWRTKYCATEYDHFAYRKERVVGEKVPGAFFNSLPCYIQLRADIENPVPEHRWVDITPTQRKLYEKLQEDAVVFLEEHPLTVSVPIAMRTRLRQITLGEPTMQYEGDDEDGVPQYSVSFAEDCRSSKIDELISVLTTEFPSEPVVIATESARFAEVVVKRLNKHYRKDVAGLWAGQTRTNADARDKLKAEFLAGDKRFIVGVIQAMGTGTDGLQRVCSAMVVLSELEGRPSEMEQLYRRLTRTGQERPVRIIKILARNTYDAGIMSAIVARAIENNESRRKKTGEEVDKSLVSTVDW